MENEISNAAVPARASRRRKAPAPFRSHRPVAPPQVSPTANVAAVLSATRGVTVVGVGRTARPPLAVPLASAPQACAWSDGGECLVVGDSAGALYFVDAATGAALLSQPLAGGDASVEFCRIVVPRCVSSSSSGAPSVHGQLLVLERSGRLHRFAGIEFGAIRDAAREDDRDALRRAKGRITCALSTVGDERSVPVDMQATVRQHRVITFVAASGSGAFAGVTAWSLSCGADAASKQPRKVDAARPAQLGGEPVRLCLAGAQREWLFALSSVGVMTWWKVNSSSSSGVRLAKLGQWDGGVLRSDAVSVAPTISDCAPLSVWRSSGGGDADDSSGGVLHLALQTTVPARVYVVRASVARPDRPECIGEPHTLTEDVSLAVSSDGGIHTVRIVRDGVALDRVMESPAGFAAPSESGALEASGDVEQLRARLLAVNALAADEEELASILADLRALLRTSAARGDRILAMRVCKAVRPVPIETVRKFVDIVRSVVDLNRDESDEAQQLPAKLRDGVVAVLRRWTTFELLASVVRCASGDPVATLDGRYWTQFRDAPLHNVVAKILSRGSVSWAQLVWRRHCEQDEGQQLRASIVDLLSSLPHTAAVATAATRWLRSDVIPHLASAQLRHLATWLDMRARELESEGDDCRAALEVAGVLSEFEEKISTSKSSAPTATTVGGTMSTPANEVQMYVRAMQVAGCEVKSEMRKLFDLHRALRDQAFLLEEMGVDIALESIEGVTPVKIAGRVFDQMCNAESSLTCKAAMARALRYCSRHNLQTDDVIETYIKEVLMRAEFSSSSLVHRRVIATLYCIESIQTRFAAALLVLRAARAPFGEEINELLRVCSVWATATSQIETLREQQQLMALHGVLARHRLDPDVFNIADSNSARLLLSHLLTCVEDDSSLADGLIVAAAYDDLSRTLACAVFLENLSVATPMDHNLDESVDQRVARCVTLLRSFELTEQRIIGRRVVNFCLSTLLECEFSADDELRCQQRWAERVSVALAAAFLREVIRSGDESDKAVDSALLHDVEVIACLQSEFDVFLSVESLQSDFHCERILDWVMQPFVAQTANGDASSFSTTPNIVVEKMELRPLTSITQLFRIGELLGVCRTSMQGELARQLGLHGDVGAAVEWCDEVCRDHDSSESHAAALSTKVLRDTSVALIEFVARNSSVFNTQDARFEARGDGRSGSRTQASAASSQSRIPLFVRQLLMQTVALCPDSELVSVVDLAAKAELVAAIFSECELGEYHCLWEKQSSHLHEPKVPGRLAHYHAWFREAALVLNTQSAMELAFAYSFASTRNLLSCGQTLVDHLQENGFEQLALRVLGHCLAISPSINSADGCTARIFGSMLTKALCSKNQVDIDFSLSCMLSMPKKEAKSAYHEALLVGSIHKGKHRDFQRLESLGHLGRRLGTTWQDEQRRSKGEALARHARWWHRLTEFGIDFNHLAWWGTWQKLGQSATFAKNLLGELLLRSNNNLELAKSFARSFQIAPSDPLLMFIEAVAQEPNACNSEAQRSAIEDAIESTLSITTACHSLDFLLERLVGKIAGDDYESLLFLRTMQVRARVRLAEEEEEEGKRSSVAEDDDVDIDEEDAKDRCAFSRRHALVLRILLQWRESASAMDGSTKLSYHDLFSTPASPSEDTTSSAFSLGRSASSSSSSAMNWDVLKAALSVENVKHLIPLHAPLQLDSDRFYVCLLDRMIPSTVLASAEHVNKALTSTIKSVCDLLTRIQRTATAIRTAKQLVKQWPKDGSKIFLLEQMEATCSTWAGRDDEETMIRARTSLLGFLNDTKDELCLRACFGAEQALAMMTADVTGDDRHDARPKKIVSEIYRTLAGANVPLHFDVHSVADEFGSRYRFDVERVEKVLAHEWLAHGYSTSTDEEGSSNGESPGAVSPAAASGTESIFALTAPEAAALVETQTVRAIVFVLSSSSRRKNHCAMLLKYSLEENVKRTYTARVRALRAAFKLVDLTELDHIATRVRKSLLSALQEKERGEKSTTKLWKQSSLVDPEWSIATHWQYCMYMEELQALRIPLTLEQLKHCDKTGLVRSIWKEHHCDVRGIRLLSKFMLDFESQSTDLWSALLGQMRRVGLHRELIFLLKPLAHFKCFAYLHSQGDAVRGFAEVWTQALEAPLREHLVATRDGELDAANPNASPAHVVAVMQAVASAIEACPFVEQLDMSGLRKCVKKLLAREQDADIRQSIETLATLCAVTRGAFVLSAGIS